MIQLLHRFFLLNLNRFELLIFLKLLIFFFELFLDKDAFFALAFLAALLSEGSVSYKASIKAPPDYNSLSLSPFSSSPALIPE